MGRIAGMTGNQAAAEAMRQIRPEVCAAYPITPSTQVMETFAQFVADGVIDTELIAVESEHSAMSACVGAAAAGARVMTATSSQGLALMHEVLYVASGLRLPIVVAVANRALSAPINIHGDHSDTMGSRDAGWIQLYCEDVQEVYDSLIQAVRIAEHSQVLLPVMVCFDGFTTSHTIERLEVLEDAEVRELIPAYRPVYPLLDLNHPVTYGAFFLQDYYTETKRQQREGMAHAVRVIREVGETFGRQVGRFYGLFEAYRLDDARVAIVIMGSAAGTVKVVVDQLREAGVKAGLLKLRAYRPFPAGDLVAALASVEAIAVLDRADSLGAMGGPLFTDLRAALHGGDGRTQVVNYIYGLGGRDILPEEIRRVYDRLAAVAAGTEKPGEVCRYLNVREHAVSPAPAGS
jgi:pyruvate ferredoxin oxidoreductase alpha subunit